jgi:hypothetical protein
VNLGPDFETYPRDVPFASCTIRPRPLLPLTLYLLIRNYKNGHWYRFRREDFTLPNSFALTGASSTGYAGELMGSAAAGAGNPTHIGGTFFEVKHLLWFKAPTVDNIGVDGYLFAKTNENACRSGLPECDKSKLKFMLTTQDAQPSYSSFLDKG